ARMPLIGRLTIQRATAFERDIVQVLAIDQRGPFRVVVLASIERGVDRRTRLYIEPYPRPQMKLSRRVLPGWDVNLATARFAAGINGFLQSRARIIALAAGCAVVLDIEKTLRWRRLAR